MSFISWLRDPKRSDLGQRRRIPAASRQRSTFRPHLEALEDRWMPSTLTVLNTQDSGPGSLRAEIAAAQSGDTIVFDPSLGYPIINVTSELVINKNLTIQGPVPGLLTIKALCGTCGSSMSRLFEVDGASTTVNLSWLTITNGIGVALAGVTNANDGEGGAILNFGMLTLSNCTLSNNSFESVFSSVSKGGAIYNAGTLTVSACTLSSNSASFMTYGANGGAIYNAGTLTVSNSYLTGNTASGFGGAIYSGYGTTATITGTTFTQQNSAGYGGGIYNAGTMTLSGCFLEANWAYQGGDIYNDRSGFLRIWSSTIGDIYNNGGHVQFKH